METDDYQINYVNINLGHQYGISVGEAQKLNVPSDKKQGDTIVFAGYYLKASDRIASWITSPVLWSTCQKLDFEVK